VLSLLQKVVRAIPTYFTITLTNLPLEAGIQIASVKTEEPVGSITKVIIKRRLSGVGSYLPIGEQTITTADDFTFTVKDFNVKSRYTYDYMLMPAAGETEGVGVTATKKCEFDGFYIGDTVSRYVCNLNPKVEFQPNGETGINTSLGSQYPFVIENSIADYYSGKASGLFLPTPTGSYNQAEAQTATALDYKIAVITFLKTKTNKLLKTFDGHAWYVRVKGRPAEVPSEYDGASEISFEWVEVAVLPTTGVVAV